MSLRLIIEDDEGSTTVVPLASEAITIGRQQGNTIQLTEKNVSRQHARLFPEQDGWVIEDLGSYNGVKVNNEVVDGRTKLREGDVVEIGDYHLAITEDVDKSPLNFRSGQAANGGVAAATSEPLLVSSSADLPRLSAEEIAALQSGQQPIAAAPPHMAVDSGPVPVGQYPAGYAGQPEKKKNTGLLIFLAFAVLGLIVLGVFFALNAGKGSDEVAASEGKADKAPADDKKNAAPPPAAAADDGAEPAAEPIADVGAEAEPAAADDGAIVEDDAGLDAGADDGEEPVEIIEDEQPTATKPKPRPKTKRPKPKPQPKPSVDADALLKEARAIQYTNPSGAYRKAKESYAAKPHRDTLWVMGFAACRMKDRGKAQYVLKRLKGAERTKLKDHCAQKGLEL
ncbi:MAG: FHA domain-containing protein [Myxococcota bacterium]